MREGCGCAALDALAEDHTTDRAEREARESLGREMQRAWGCDGAGRSTPVKLSRSQREAREDWERITRTRCGAGCPMAAARRSSPWLAEIVRAARVARSLKGAQPIASQIGREPHVWDVRALEEFVLVGDAVEASDARVREREREQRDAEAKARGR